MAKIRIAEIFGNTIQGEGLHMGVPSVFIRTFGCNFRCKDFGCDTPTVGPRNAEVEQVIHNISQYTTYESLPLVSTGCDSYPAVYPEFAHLSKNYEIPQLVDEIQSIIHPKMFGPDLHLILTGGEPLLGWQREYPELFQETVNRGLNLTNITFETNGTQWVRPELNQSISDLNLVTTFSVSPKLPNSGEAWEAAIKPDVVSQYSQVPNSTVTLKFVVGNDHDVVHVDRAVRAYRDHGFAGPVYLMPVGGVGSVYFKNAREVAELAIAKGYRYSARLQVDLFGNDWGT